jgi:hypothetical protein
VSGIESLEVLGAVFPWRVLHVRVAGASPGAPVSVPVPAFRRPTLCYLVTERPASTAGTWRYAFGMGRTRIVSRRFFAAGCRPFEAPCDMKVRIHLTPLVLMAVLSLVWTWPLVRHFQTHLAGAAGDNFSFLWNLWWMRHVLASPGLAFFHSDFLFHPFGVDLVNHPHTALQGVISATVLARLSIVEAENLYVLVSLFGNALAAYALAMDLTGHRRSAMLAAVTFGGSPYIAAHLLGHFDLLSAWVLPVFALVLRRALRDGWRMPAVGCGLTAAVAAYTAYYYVVYIGLIGVSYVVAWSQCVSFGVQRRPQTPMTSRLRHAVLGAIAVDCAVAAWILMTGGGTLSAFGMSVSARTVQGPLTVAWAMMIVGALTRWRIFLGFRSSSRESLRRGLRVLALAAVVFVVCAAPLMLQAGSLVAQGRYSSQPYFWRSAPRGVDVLAAVLGNPFHPVAGDVVTNIYRAAHLDRIEGVAWLGVVPLLLLVGPRGRWVNRREAGCWLAVGGVSALWALGPSAKIGGFDIGLPLPQSLVRFVPIVSDARMPGRAMVMVYLALAMLLALRLPALEGRWRKPAWQSALVLGVVLDYLGAPIPLTRLDQPLVYQTLAALRDEGAVCEIPLGIGDGLTAGVGRQDRRVLYYATLHGHPLVGGFIGRMPPGAADAYAQMPIVGNLLRLSNGQPPVGGGDSPASMVPFRYVVIDRTSASAELNAYVHSRLDLELLAAADGKELYSVRGKD